MMMMIRTLDNTMSHCNHCNVRIFFIFLLTRRKKFSIIPFACRQDRRQLPKHSFAWGGS